MALCNRDNKQYIRFLNDGTYYIYASTKARKDHKNNRPKTMYNKIIRKYHELLDSYSNSLEQLYYDPEMQLEVNNILAELAIFEGCSTTFDIKTALLEGQFPIMSKYFSKLEEALPNIIASGRISLIANEDLAQVYIQGKQYFQGNWEDC